METKNFAFGGITRSIGGAVCGDGDLHIAVDVCNDGAGLTLLEKEKVLFTMATGEEFLCVHEPEGEGKHYITQLEVVAAPSTPTRDGSAIEQGEDDPEETVVEEEVATILDQSPYAGTFSPTIENDAVSYGPYTPSQEVETDVTTTNFEVELGNLYQHDSGGNITNAPSSSSENPNPIPTDAGIYLCYWAETDVVEDGQTVKRFRRLEMIDITPYGKITAIQPMGNTLVANHEGATTTIDSEEVTYPAEIRYWLWKVEESQYIGLGAKPPFVDISFGLNSTFEYYPKTANTFTGGGALKKYGGTFVTSYPYTNTVPLYWNKVEGQSYVPPLDLYRDGTYTTDAFAQTDSDVFSHWQSTYSIDDVESPNGKTDVAGMRTNWTTMVLGCYNKFIAEQHKVNKFVFPFYVRYAYELYDGSLIMHSNPVLMIPNSRGPIFALDGKKGLKADLDDSGHSYEKVRLEFRGRTYGFSSTLMRLVAKLSEEDQARLENWKDLIRGINIYITPPIYNYKQSGQVLGWKCMSEEDTTSTVSWANGEWSKYYTVGKTKYTDVTGVSPVEKDLTGCYSMFWGFDEILKKTLASNHKNIFMPWEVAGENNSTIEYRVPDYVLDIPQKEEDEVKELHENAGQFFKLGSIEYEKLIELTQETTPVEEAIDIGNNKVNTISNQDFMQDDSGSLDTLSASVMYGYNRRINIAGIKKILHSPLLPSVTFAKDYDSAYNYQIIIYAKNGAKIARLKSSESSVYAGFPQYIFYPNTDAFEALIYRQLAGTAVLKYKVPLKEHKALNGAFWLADFINNISDIENYRLSGYATAAELAELELNNDVDESSKIYTSETDNPFYFPLTNRNIAGGGEVRALCAATQAMSQGQFGQHPMYCFTSEGVWAMTVNDTGGWGTIQPVTRDVINAGTKPLSLDSTVLFLSDRGLLQLAGAETTPLSGAVRSYDYSTYSKLADATGFTGLATATNTGALLTAANALTAFPDVATLTYDAKSGRVYVTPVGIGASWVLNLRSGLWTQATTHIDTQVPTYPGCEGQQGNQMVEIGSTLGYQKDKGLVVTRPVKFGDGSILKRITEMAVRGQFKPYGGYNINGNGKETPACVQTALWGTREWLDFALVASSKNNRLTRWGGSPYFGHAFGLFLTKPSDYILHVVGVDAVVDIERVNKIR